MNRSFPLVASAAVFGVSGQAASDGVQNIILSQPSDVVASADGGILAAGALVSPADVVPATLPPAPYFDTFDPLLGAPSPASQAALGANTIIFVSGGDTAIVTGAVLDQALNVDIWVTGSFGDADFAIRARPPGAVAVPCCAPD